ncbi:MAG TPA: hypothetical protein DCL15_10370 [Chloroflexi bacterium]|nr:hypothetical protein [Chloroflexota bacterium]HHW88985.1 glycosyltransferase family 2 protein [Chloroflexota bacterium]
MKEPLLTIAIPTYNRAQKLDKQLAWAVNAIDGRWDEVELIVSDNASPDETPQVCEKWKAVSQGNLQVQRQQTNVGLVRNVLFCITKAQGEFVWVVGDDDTILADTLDWVLKQLWSNQKAGLSYLHLNVQTQNGYEGEILQERVYPFQNDKLALPGVKLFQECADLEEGWMLLITANIYATHTVRKAIARWPHIRNNLAFPLFLSGYAAMNGSMMVRAEPSLIYPHHTGSHLQTWLKTVYHDIPAAYWALYNEGYGADFIRRRILMRVSFLVYAIKFPIQFVKSMYVYLMAAILKPK